LLADSTTDGKIDVNSILDHVSSLKKENRSLKIKFEQQDRLIKSLKDKE
jgi:regulator of sigma D